MRVAADHVACTSVNAAGRSRVVEFCVEGVEPSRRACFAPFTREASDGLDPGAAQGDSRFVPQIRIQRPQMQLSEQHRDGRRLAGGVTPAPIQQSSAAAATTVLAHIIVEIDPEHPAARNVHLILGRCG